MGILTSLYQKSSSNFSSKHSKFLFSCGLKGDSWKFSLSWLWTELNRWLRDLLKLFMTYINENILVTRSLFFLGWKMSFTIASYTVVQEISILAQNVRPSFLINELILGPSLWYSAYIFSISLQPHCLILPLKKKKEKKKRKRGHSSSSRHTAGNNDSEHVHLYIFLLQHRKTISHKLMISIDDV